MLKRWRDPVYIAAAGSFLVGVLARLWIFTSPMGEVNSDEAIVGLMSTHLLAGEWSPFFWGQSYGGTLDVLLLAPVVAVLGNSFGALQVIPVLQSLAATLLIWAIARRAIGSKGAVVAAALFWTFPAAFVWWQTRQSLLYLPVTVLGLVAVLAAQRLVEDPGRRVDWWVFGLAIGLGWWTSPQILYFALPAAVWLALRLPRAAMAAAWRVVPAFVLGAAPWLLTNIREGWPSLTDVPVVADGPLDRIRAALAGGFPMSLGLKTPFTEEWLLPAAGPVPYLLLAPTVGVWWLAKRPFREPHFAILVAFLPLFTLIPAAAYVGSGRYFFFLAAPLAITLASLPGSDIGKVVLLLIAAGVTAVGLYRMQDLQVSFVPPVEPLVGVLEERNVEHVVGGFWLAYKLTWETSERIVASPVAVNRYPAFLKEVRAAQRVAYVYNLYELSQRASAEALRSWLDEQGYIYDETEVAGHLVLIPHAPVDPLEIPLAAVPSP